MASTELGKFTIPAAGGIQLTSTENTRCHAIFVQALEDNSGKGYLGKSGLNKVTLASVSGMIPKPSASDETSLPSFTLGLDSAHNAFDAYDYYLDGTAADVFLVTLTVN